MREAGFGIKAATVTPEGADDVGSPNRILREDVGGRVIIRTGRRIPGVTPVAGVHPPSRSCAWPSRTPMAPSSGVRARTALPTRSPSAPSGSRGEPAAPSPSTPSGRRGGWAGRVYGGPKWTVSPVYEGMLKEEMDAAAARHADVPYQPVLIDATYAGLITAPPTSRSSCRRSTATGTA